MKKPELLAPAGNLEKLKIAILYGADAVYCGGFNFGLRAGADNFSPAELQEGTEFAHQQGARIYITVNMIPHNEDLKELPDYLGELEKIGVDGLIVSDPGVIRIIREQNVNLPLHLSTQANNVNWQSVLFWQELGLERIILARELSGTEIAEIAQKTEIELEMFVHGAMCISYSGRCLLSNYLTGRDANRGQCAHTCRWKYHLMENERPGEYYPVYEDENGTYILNSRDLCLIEHLPEIVACGIDSLKIEGRMKGLHYTATVTRVYRQALEQLFEAHNEYVYNPSWEEELKKVSHRPYTTGFFTGDPEEKKENTENSTYRRSHDFMGIVRDYDSQNRQAVVEVRNKFFQSDKVEIFGPDCDPFSIDVEYIINEEGERVTEAPHAQELIRIPVPRKVEEYFLVRRKK